MRYQQLISQMTLKEKIDMLSGSDMWHFRGIERLGIPSLMVCDGPHGLRKQDESCKDTTVNHSVDAICFPTACATACSWDRELLRELGRRLGDEAQSENIAVVLGPGVNIKRSPLCGRNFEYFSEDPYLAGTLAAEFIGGMQSRGTGASLKHFAANNQETYRMTIDAVIDERTLREIYLAAFETAVTQSSPRTVMCSYNKINGCYGSQNSYLLTDILRKDWGFNGSVVSDWGAVVDRVEGVKAGLDIEMPTSGGISARNLADAIDEGRLSEDVIDARVDNVLGTIFECARNKREGVTYDKKADAAFSRLAASKSAVLLKNDGILPLSKSKKYLLVGEMADKPRFQGAGSSFINCTEIISLRAAMERLGIDFEYEQGYRLESEEVDAKLIRRAVQKAADCDAVIIATGLPSEYEAEGFDRKNLSLPASHTALIEALAAVSDKLVAVLSTGGCVELPWHDKASSILCMYLGGQCAGAACSDILFGEVNPCGKLAETFPISLSDVAASNNFPGQRYSVEYREGLMVGYRYFDSAAAEVRYPFGHGLSYTRFEYGDLKFSSNQISDGETLEVGATITNVGERDGEEIVQLYVRDVESGVYMPTQQLKGYTKVFLKSGESKQVAFKLGRRAFAFWDVKTSSWQVENGTFEIRIAASSRDIRLKGDVVYVGGLESADDGLAGTWYASPSKAPVGASDFERLLCAPLPSQKELPVKGNFTSEDCIEDMAPTSAAARFTLKVARVGLRLSMHASKNDPNYRMIYEVMKTSPIRSLSYSSQGVFNNRMADGVVTIMNGHFFKGLGQMLKGFQKEKPSK